MVFHQSDIQEEFRQYVTKKAMVHSLNLFNNMVLHKCFEDSPKFMDMDCTFNVIDNCNYKVSIALLLVKVADSRIVAQVSNDFINEVNFSFYT